MSDGSVGDDDEDEWLREAEMIQKISLESESEKISAEAMALQRAIAASLLTSSNSWEVRTARSYGGRHLVSTRTLPADTIVFQEQPIVVGEAIAMKDQAALPGELIACATELLNLPPDSSARLLQPAAPSPESRSARMLEKAAEQLLKHMERDAAATDSLDYIKWALGVSMVNCHGATKPDRGVLGVLASMMEVHRDVELVHQLVFFPWPALTPHMLRFSLPSAVESSIRVSRTAA